MSENFKIGNYTMETQKVYSTLSDLDVSDSDLKEIDKNNDSIISEDELVDFAELEDDNNTESKKDSSYGLETTAEMGEEYSDDMSIRSYQMKRDQEILKMRRLNYKLKKAEIRLKAAEARSKAFAEDSTAKSKVDSYVDECQNKVDNISSEITTCTNNILNYNVQIEQIQAQKAAAAAQAASSSNSNTSTDTASGTTSGTGGTSSTTGNYSYVEGSGAELAKVDGDLSICLDRIASSLGTSREQAADYIATVCKDAGAGYFDPKIIVSLIFSESGGDNSASSDPNYVGFGQMSAVAVEEVNRQFGTNFSFSDMSDPAKNIEALTYLLRFQYERYDHNLGKALTAYNVGNCESGVINGYAQGIMARV